MQIEERTITPDLAALYLKLNTKNRIINWPHVDFLALQMSSGVYRCNGDTIRFTKSKVLADGQHRLHAIIKSGASIPMIIVTGLDDDIVNYIDTNSKPRRHADVLTLNKHKNTSLLASLYPLVNSYYVGAARYATKVSSRTVLAFVEQNPEAINAAAFTAGHKPWLLPLSVVGTFHFIASKAGHQTKGEEFLLRFNSGQDLSAGNPILSFRNSIIGARNQGRNQGSLIQKFTTLGRMIKTYNNWLQGISVISNWTFKAGKKFPEIIEM
jgi:hypothetical protein